MALEPFIQLNHNAFLHSTKAFGGKPQRIREIKADFEGGDRRTAGQGDPARRARRSRVERGSGDIAGGAARARRPRQRFSLPGRRGRRRTSAAMRRDPGGGLSAAPANGEPIGISRHSDLPPVARLAELSRSTISKRRCFSRSAAWAASARRLRAQIPNAIRYGAKVTAIHQDERGVTSHSRIWPGRRSRGGQG